MMVVISNNMWPRTVTPVTSYWNSANLLITSDTAELELIKQCVKAQHSALRMFNGNPKGPFEQYRVNSVELILRTQLGKLSKLQFQNLIKLMISEMSE